MATLLEKALAVAVRERKVPPPAVSREEVELMVALTEGAVTRQQVAAVLALKPGSVEGRRAVVFVRAVRAGMLAVPPFTPQPSRGPSERYTTPALTT